MRKYEPKNRPGVIIYFDMRPALGRLSMKQRGELLTAALNYAEYGEIPELDGMTGMCFDMLRPKIDRDAESYESKVMQSRYAGYCSRTRAKGNDPLDYEEWLVQNGGATTVDDRELPLSAVDGGQPNKLQHKETTKTATTENRGCKEEGEHPALSTLRSGTLPPKAAEALRKVLEQNGQLTVKDWNPDEDGDAPF